MRRYLRYANLIALCAGAIGMLLMLWIHLGGTDDNQLYPTNHPAWTLLMVLTALALPLFWLLSCEAGNASSFRANFPASAVGAVGRLAAGIGLVVAGIDAFQESSALGFVVGLMGIAGGLMLFWAAWCRYLGHKCNFPPHVPPCFFFAARLFLLGQTLGSEPEIYRYLFGFLSALSMLPACYWLWSFDVGMGRRQHCLFWCLTAAYCNLVAAAGCSQWIMHLAMAIWMLTNLPRLKYLAKRPRPAAPQETPAAPQEISPAFQDASEPDQESLSVEEANALLEQLINEFGSNTNP